MTTSASPRARFYDEIGAGERAFRARMGAISADERVLEFGCGIDSQAIELATRGITCLGISTEPVDVERARVAAADAGVTTATFGVMSAEHLELPDHSIDVIIGAGVLHRLDIALAYAEFARVLRPSGRVVLLEPLGHNALINAYRRRTPEGRARFEHPIRREEVSLASRWFRSVELESHQLVSIAATSLRSSGARRVLQRSLDHLDRVLLRRGSALRWQAWVGLLELEDPR